jgi:hypothetical protein
MCSSRVQDFSLASSFMDQMDPVSWQHFHQGTTNFSRMVGQLTTCKVDKALPYVD